MTVSWKLLLFAASCIVCTTAHICLVYPHQRGSMADLNSIGMMEIFVLDQMGLRIRAVCCDAGAADCGLTEPPCGGRDAETPRVFFE